MSERWSLTMSLCGQFGERYTMAIGLDDACAREVVKLSPLTGIPGLDSFENVVETLSRKEYRKDLFISEARRLGTLLAERMEDAEGWHDASRIEPAKKQLRG